MRRWHRPPDPVYEQFSLMPDMAGSGGQGCASRWRIRKGVLKQGADGRSTNRGSRSCRRRPDRTHRRLGPPVGGARQGRHPEGVSRRPHGLFATHKDQFNADLLDFIQT
jgi:hypothetical protein